MAIQTLGDGPKGIPVKFPVVVAQAIKEAADADYVSQQAWIRQVVIDRLRTDGRLP